MNVPNIKVKPMTETGEATALLPVESERELSPITVVGTRDIRNAFDELALKQAVNARTSPGVSRVVLNPDAHAGYGAPVGCVMVSPTHVYPGPVGVDIKCSMSLLQTNLTVSRLKDQRLRRKIMEAIAMRVPSGAGRGRRHARLARAVPRDFAIEAAVTGASAEVCRALQIPEHWAQRCEDAFHVGHDDTPQALRNRLELHLGAGGLFEEKFDDKCEQFGSYGGGNHFGEAEAVELVDDAELRRVGEYFGLRDGCVAFLSHCGSRGFGFNLANHQFKSMQEEFRLRERELPGGDREMVHAELATPMANAYLDDMALGANFATVNHMLINALVLEAFQEVLPSVEGRLVYFISHNIARREVVDGQPAWVHRKGATRAFPANHPALAKTPFATTGHPILLPGNPMAGSAVMVAQPGAELTCYSVNHGAGRKMSRREAFRRLHQQQVDASLDSADILTNCRKYPLDEAPAAYKNFKEVLRSVELAGLAKSVAKLKALFVIKDGDTRYGGAA